MRIHELRTDQGVVYAFEVSALLGRRGACKVAAAIPGVRVTRTPALFSSQNEEFCEFELRGELYVIAEPFQDSSRYWVGPKKGSAGNSLGEVANHFATHKTGKQALLVGAAFVVALLAVAAITSTAKFVRQDRCLDSRGRWHASNSTCEGAQP